MNPLEPVVINASDLTMDEIAYLRSQGFETSEQGTEAWLEERLGLATASNFFKIIDWTKGSVPDKLGIQKTKPTPKAPYYQYMNELVGERLAGKLPRFKSRPMEWGTNHEEEAANIYQELTGYDVRETGFVRLDDLEAGASTDRLVEEDGVLEIKCPNTATHIEYLDKGIPPQYYAQIQGQMWILDKKWGDFMSYDPEMPENAQSYIQRIDRDDDYIKDMQEKVHKFLIAVDKKELKIRQYQVRGRNNEI